MRTNPFYELYLADSTSATDFVELFSPTLIPHVQQLFLPGNIVIVGMQGSGKSMLLTLLRHETRLKYAKAGYEFPVPKELRQFITCSVNLTHSNATDFGNRRWVNSDPSGIEFLFGDFVNSLLVVDLLNTVEAYASMDAALSQESGVKATAVALDAFAVQAARSRSWEGWMGEISTFQQLKERISARIVEYRSFLHHRKMKIDEAILQTRTAMGDPIAEYAGILRDFGVISNDTNVFVDIDQYEELANIKTADPIAKKIDYRSVINRALSRRDPRLSYRVGSRKHSWRMHGNILGSIGKLENERDYKFIDLDLLLRRPENSRTYIFPLFAEDVFKRRMKVAGFASKPAVTLSSVYGETLAPSAKAKLYTPNNPTKAIKLEERWRPETKNRLTELAQKNPLSARLGEAWVRQKGEGGLDVHDSALPWANQIYWQKERVEIALVQIASSNQQKVIFSGASDICDLSSGNILVFVSLNQRIWDMYFRYEAKISPEATSAIPKIGKDLQTAGVFKASEHWAMKIEEETGRSSSRLKFVKEVARRMREKVMNDRALSNPGATGFSLREDELDGLAWVRDFLGEIADYGSFIESPHTTKEQNKATRLKWYISPILCPWLRLPFVRTKEPYYAKFREVLEWLHAANVVSPIQEKIGKSSVQSTLFED